MARINGESLGELVRLSRTVVIVSTVAVAMVVVDPALFEIGGRYARLADLTSLRVGLFGTPLEAEEWLTALEG